MHVRKCKVSKLNQKQVHTSVSRESDYLFIIYHHKKNLPAAKHQSMVWDGMLKTILRTATYCMYSMWHGSMFYQWYSQYSLLSELLSIAVIVICNMKNNLKQN